MSLLLKVLTIIITFNIIHEGVDCSEACETYEEYLLRHGQCLVSTSGDYCRDAFVCKNFECIPTKHRCDGIKHCPDGDDETEQLCPYFDCPENSFRCKYGACVSAYAKCNGTVECADGSDESVELCPSEIEPIAGEVPGAASPPQPVIGCFVPPQPENGNYVSPNPTERFFSGQILDDGKVLIYKCNENYALNSMQEIDYVLCFNKKWIKDFPFCLNTCPPLTGSVATKCEYGDKEFNCSLPLLHGTRVTTSCKLNYESKNSSTGHSVSVCKGGSWDHDVIKCVPECGKVVAEGTAFAVNAFSAKRGTFPWHVGIYIKDDANSSLHYVCGGSLIKMNIVLSAAHCFADENDGSLGDISLYAVAAGKYYRRIDDPRDVMQQASCIKHININEDYKGILNNYRDDIAIIELQQPFTVSPVVQPVCVDWENQYEEEQLRPDSLGDVVGWGFTEEEGVPSEELQQLRIPYIEGHGCYQILPRTFYPYITTDKFCGGHTNGSSVCKGDSGGGLVFFQNTSGRYYIRGIVSSGPRKKLGCDSFKYSLFTKISVFMHVISKAIADSVI